MGPKHKLVRMLNIPVAEAAKDEFEPFCEEIVLRLKTAPALGRLVAAQPKQGASCRSGGSCRKAGRGSAAKIPVAGNTWQASGGTSTALLQRNGGMNESGRGPSGQAPTAGARNTPPASESGMAGAEPSSEAETEGPRCRDASRSPACKVWRRRPG